MSWGEELWDQYENLSAHTHKGLEFLDKYGQFIKEWSSFEIEYASKLRRLVKNHQIKKKDDEENHLTVYNAFNLMTQVAIELAGHHDSMAENMSTNIVKEISFVLKELKDERKKYLEEGDKYQNALHKSLQKLDKAKESYKESYKEAKKAERDFQKAFKDLNLPRKELEEKRLKSEEKKKKCENCKTEYANLLPTTNKLQRLHFSELMPKLFDLLQKMDERRADCIQEFMKQSALIQRQVFPIIDKCLEGIIKASETIDSKEDSLQVIEKYKSGDLPPEDIVFYDLSDPRPESETLRGTLSADRFKIRGGIIIPKKKIEKQLRTQMNENETNLNESYENTLEETDDPSDDDSGQSDQESDS